LGLGSCLIKSGQQVTFVGRRNTVDALRRTGLHRTGIFGDFFASENSFNSIASVADYSDDPTAILVCTKAFDTEHAAQELAANSLIANSDCPIVLCQNGWGNAEVFAHYFERERIFNARVITGFERSQFNHVKVTVHAATIHFGGLFGNDNSRVAELCERITAGGIPTAPTDSIEKDLWSKMLYNCCLNPLGATLDAKYGQLGDSEYARDIMNRAAGEIFETMHAAGFQTHWPTTDRFLEAFYRQMIPPTYEHASSMLQDVRAGHRTEIDRLNGAVVELAAEHHIPVPVNTALVNLIRCKESNFRSTPVRMLAEV